MFNKKAFKAALLACVFLFPQFAQAADDSTPNDAWIGTKWQSDTALKYGRYNDSVDKGPSLLGGFSVNKTTPWDSPLPNYYFKVDANDLNIHSGNSLRNSSGSANVGLQGLWGAKLYVDNIGYNQSNTFHTLYSDADGNLVPGVTSGSINLTGVGYDPAAAPVYPGNSTANATSAAASATVDGLMSKNTIVGTERQITGGALNYTPFSDWKFSTDFKHENKTGSKENSLVIANTGINVATGTMLYFAEPIDYDTNRYSLMAAYNRQRVQAQVSYTVSTFTNKIASFNAKDPFNTTVLHAGYLNSVYSLPPDNSAHQFRGKFGYTFSPKTRWTADLAYGMILQNDAFVAQTNAPTSSVPTDIGQTSYNGKAQNLSGNITMLTKPTPKLDVKASVNYNIYDNRSARLTFHAVGQDNATCTAINYTGCNAIISNIPISYKTRTFAAEGGYRLTPATKLLLGETYKITDRTNSASLGHHENTVSAQVNSQMSDRLSSSLGADRSVRAIKNYNGSRPWILFGDPAHAGGVENAGLAHFFEADRIRDQVKGRMSVAAGNDSSFSVSGKFYRDDYDHTTYGLIGDNVISVNPDVALSLSEDITTHLFYSYERANYHMRDRATVTGLPYFNWTRDTANNIHTIGFSGDWKATSKLKLGLNYMFQRGNTGWNIEGASSLNPTTSITGFYNYLDMTMPSDSSTTNRVDLTGEYELMDSVALKMAYAFEAFRSTDYLNNQLSTAATYPNYVLPGDGNPGYVVHTIGASLNFKW